MSIQPGTHKLGPENGTLRVNTKRTGAAAKAGHDLTIQVDNWNATLTIGDDPSQSSLELDADADSLRVLEGQGGIQSLGDDDKKNIKKTIDDDVLKRQGIEFHSTSVSDGDNGHLRVTGELTIVGKTAPVSFDIMVRDDGNVSGSAVVKQTDHGMKPYSALFGALKVADEVTVSIEECALPSS
ncbi:MAG TPA: YceI family protein [Solirubrobacteraceae bacterium]|jgi:polyisoprenoid-binding protein YceI|nr:YceI family protein [Solirubrobacteraceae bacterium]